MEITAIQFWLTFGALLIFSEIILPGLVSAFIGMGAITVAILLKYNYMENIPSQLITWFISSTLYIFTLRLLVMKYYPMDTVKGDINEDDLVIGSVVKVVEDISDNAGRISIGETTWSAKSVNGQVIKSGSDVKILKRDNITWLVEPTKKEN